jgi:hypothetical protein
MDKRKKNHSVECLNKPLAIASQLRYIGKTMREIEMKKMNILASVRQRERGSNNRARHTLTWKMKNE